MAILRVVHKTYRDHQNYAARKWFRAARFCKDPILDNFGIDGGGRDYYGLWYEAIYKVAHNPPIKFWHLKIMPFIVSGKTLEDFWEENPKALLVCASFELTNVISKIINHRGSLENWKCKSREKYELNETINFEDRLDDTFYW